MLWMLLLLLLLLFLLLSTEDVADMHASSHGQIKIEWRQATRDKVIASSCTHTHTHKQTHTRTYVDAHKYT